MRTIFLACLLALSAWAAPAEARKIRLGQKMPGFTLKDSNGKTWHFSDFKEPVLAVWYEGKNSKEQNRWLKTKMKKLFDQNVIPQKKFRSVGIANFQETAVPNWLIRRIIRSEIRRTGAVILNDESGMMMKLWGFRNGRSNIYVLDKQRRLRWRSSGPLSKKRGHQLIRFIIRLCHQY